MAASAGIVYDAGNDLVEIALENLDHLIRAPREIYVEEGPSGLASMEVVDRDGVRHLFNSAVHSCCRGLRQCISRHARRVMRHARPLPVTHNP